MKFAFRLKWLGDGQGTTEGRRKEERGNGRGWRVSLLQSQLWDAPALPALFKTKHTHIPSSHSLQTNTPLLSNTHRTWILSADLILFYCRVPTWLGQGCRGARHSISPPSVLQLHMPDICIFHRLRSYKEEVGSVLNLCLNHIKTALCNFKNNLTSSVPNETDNAPCPNIEPLLPNGREGHFISPCAISALYCRDNIIISFNNILLGALKING